MGKNEMHTGEHAVLTPELVSALGLAGVTAAELHVLCVEMTLPAEAIVKLLDKREQDKRTNLEWLETGIDKILPGKECTRARNALMRLGIRSARDLFVLGQKQIRALYGIGDGIAGVISEAVDSAIQEEGITLDWLDEPTMQDIVRYTDGDPARVHPLVLEEYELYGHQIVGMGKDAPTNMAELSKILTMKPWMIAEEIRAPGRPMIRWHDTRVPHYAGLIEAGFQKFMERYAAAKQP